MSRRSILICILLIAAALRLIALSNGDAISDEVLYAFRAIKLIDFDAAPHQTTPVEWFDQNGPPNGSWWLKFSFHDHPPLVFWVQHVFIKIFGENMIAMRLPSALLGIASVYLLYLIGALLFAPRIGLIAAAIYAVTLNAVYISRIGLQEAYVIFSMLLVLYWFLRGLNEKKYLVWAGVAFGLGLLTKYTAGIMAPIIGTYILFFRRDLLRAKALWLGALLAFVIFSPVIIYNLKLYQAVGHFDFQISFMVGQHPEVWQATPGKDIGTLADRAKAFLPRLLATNSWAYLLAVLGAINAFVVLLIMRGVRQTPHAPQLWFIVIAIVWLTLLLLKIGPSYRFLTMLAPFLTIAVALFFSGVYQKFSAWGYARPAVIVFEIFLLFETAYAVNNQLLNYPLGPDVWLTSKVRYENYNWGYAALGEYLEKELGGKAPAITFDVKYRFLEKLRDAALAEAKRVDAQYFPALVVYDGNFDDGGQLWTLDRLHFYHAWPVISGETYRQYLGERGGDYFRNAGFRNYYFVTTTNAVVADSAMKTLMTNAFETVEIKNKRGDAAFRVFVGEL